MLCYFTKLAALVHLSVHGACKKYAFEFLSIMSCSIEYRIYLYKLMFDTSNFSSHVLYRMRTHLRNSLSYKYIFFKWFIGKQN